MYAQVESPKENTNRKTINPVSQKKKDGQQVPETMDNRTENKAQKSLQRMTATSTIQRNCTHPSGILISNAQAINTDENVGMSVATTLDPNNVSPGVLVSEQVSGGCEQTGSFTGVSGTSDTSGFMDMSELSTDSHTGPKNLFISKADEAGDGSISFNQNFIWKHPGGECATNDPAVVTKSGYQIKHAMSTGPGQKVTVVTTKAPKTVDLNSFSASAGDSGTLTKTNEIRAQ